MQTLTRDELAAALEYWILLPYAMQLEAIISCSQNGHWDIDTTVGEIRHWMTMITGPEQLNRWGASLYGSDPDISERDGEECMSIVAHAWRNRRTSPV